MEIAEFHENWVNFIKLSNSETLKSLATSVGRVDVKVIDPGEIEALLRTLKPFVKSAIIEDRLQSTKIILVLKQLIPSNQWIGAILEETITDFRDAYITGFDAGSSVECQLLVDQIQMWTKFAACSGLEEHHFYPLLSSAMHTIFPANPNLNDYQVKISRQMVKFVATSYVSLPTKAGQEILHQMISLWCKNTKLVQRVADFVLKLIAHSGQISQEKWEDAVTFKSRKTLESEALKAHQRAKEVAQLISRRLIDINWSKSQVNRKDFDKLLDECLKRCLLPQWASAEIFISAFITTLFRLSDTLRRQRYPLFMLEILRTIHDGLATLKITEPSPPGADKTAVETKQSKFKEPSVHGSIVFFLSRIPYRDQALYLASRQMVEPNQPYFDYYHALAHPQLHLRGDDTALVHDQWHNVLGQWPIVNYYSKIVKMLCDMTLVTDLKDIVQVDLFKILERVVLNNPELFQTSWLDRVRTATPAVCEAIIPLAAHVYTLTKDDTILNKLAARVFGPGAHNYKRRVLTLVVNEAQSLALKWKLLLALVADGDHSVSKFALQMAQEWLSEHGPSIELAKALSEAELADARRHQFEVKQGLSIFMRHLERREISHIQSLVSNLLQENQLDLAYTLMSVDGRVTPMSAVKFLFRKYLEVPSNSLALKLLNFCLCSRPRIIIAPNLSEQIFTELLPKLKTAGERDISSISSILGQLVSLGGLDTQNRRAATLLRVFESARTLILKRKDLANSAVFTQAVLICGGSRFWPVESCELLKVTQTIVSLVDPNDLLKTRLLLTRTAFALATSDKQVLTDKTLDTFFLSFSSSSEESQCLNKELLKLLQTPKALTMNDDSSFQKSLVGSVENKFDIISSLLIQRQLHRLITIAFTGDDVNALRVIVKAMESNLVVGDECIPVVTALAFSEDPIVAHTALRSLLCVCQYPSRNLVPKIIEGLHSIKTNAIKQNPFPMIYGMLQDTQRRTNGVITFLNSLASSLSYQGDLKIIGVLVSGFTNVEMESQHAKHLVQLIENAAGMYDPGLHELCENAKMCIVFILSLWLREKYGIPNTNTSNKSFSAAAAAIKKAHRGDSGDLPPIDFDYLWSQIINTPDQVAPTLRKVWTVSTYEALETEKILAIDDCYESPPKRTKSNTATGA